MISNDIKIIEALLFASDEPILESDLLEKIQNKEMINEYLNDLNVFYSNRGIYLKKTGLKNLK